MRLIKNKLLVVVLVFVLALGIRLININQSLWQDEATTAKVVHDFNLYQILTQFSPADFHPPFYYFVMNIWTGFFGYSEIGLRLPSVFFSLGTGYLIYLLGGLWPATFFLFNPLMVYYSQEARMYQLTVFLLMLGMYLLIKGLNSKIKTSCHYLLSGLVFALSLLTFYGSIFFIVSIIIYLLAKRKMRPFFIILYCLIAFAILISPLLLRQLQNSSESLNMVLNWKTVLGLANIKNLILIPIKFFSGRISFEPKFLYFVLAGTWSVICLFFVYLGLRKQTIFSYLLLSILFVFVVSFKFPMLQYFRLQYLLIPIVFLLSYGLKRNWQKVLLSAIFLVWSLFTVFMPQFHRADWKELSRSIPPKQLVVGIPSSLDALLYYRPDLKNKIIDVLQFKNSFGAYKLAQKVPLEIYLLPYNFGVYGVGDTSFLLNNKYQRTKTVYYRELYYEIWSK